MKRALSLLLALVMVLTCATFPTFADDTVVATIVSGTTTSREDLFPRTWDGAFGSSGSVYTYTSWTSASTEKTFTWMLDKAYDLTEAEILWTTGWYDADQNDGSPKDYTIQTTTDGTTWNDAVVKTDCTDVALGATYQGSANTLSRVDALTSNNTGVIGVRVTGKNWNGGYPAIAEVYFRGTAASVTAPDPDPELPIEPAFVSGSFYLSGNNYNGLTEADFTPDKAFDGSMDTFWWSGYGSGNKAFNLDFTLNAPTNLTGITVYWSHSSSTTAKWVNGAGVYRSDNYKIQVSSSLDGDDFVDVPGAAVLTEQSTDTDTFASLTDVNAVRRVRIAFLGDAIKYGFGIKEITAQGTIVQTVNYTIRYVDAEDETKQVADDVVASGIVGSTVTVSAKEIEDYTVDATQKEVTILEDGSAIVIFRYTKIPPPYQPDEPVGELLSLSKATASYELDEVCTASKLLDDDPTTVWVVSKGWEEKTVQIDFVLTDIALVKTIDIRWGGELNSSNPTDHPDGTYTDGHLCGSTIINGIAPADTYTILASPDETGDTFTAIDVDTNALRDANLGSSLLDRVYMENGVTAKRLRIQAVGSGITIEEIKVYGEVLPTAEYFVNYLDEDGIQLTSSSYGKALVGTTITPTPKEFGGYITPEAQTVEVTSTDKITINYVYKIDTNLPITIVGGSADTGADGHAATYDNTLKGEIYTYTSGETSSNDAVRSIWWNFDKAYDLKEVQLVWSTANDGGTIDGAPVNYILQASYDGDAWFDIKSVSGLTATSIGSTYDSNDNLLSYTDTFETPIQNVKAVRLVVTQSVDKAIAIAEVYCRGSATKNPLSNERFYPNAVTTTPETLLAVGEGTNVPANAFDGDVSTYLIPDCGTVDAVNTVSYTFTLPNVTRVDSVNLINAPYIYTTDNVASNWGAYKIEVSYDGVNYTEAVSNGTPMNSANLSKTAGGTYIQNAGVYTEFNAEADMEKVKYIRVTATSGEHPGVAELYVTGVDTVAVEGGYMYTKGANIRTASAAKEQTGGLRFATEMPRSLYEATVNGDAMTGMLLMPIGTIQSVDETCTSLTAYVEQYLADNGITLKQYIEQGAPSGKTAFLPIPAKKILAESTEDTVYFTAVLVDIPTKRYQWDICAVPYYIDAQGNTTIGDEACRSLYDVAVLVKNDTNLFNSLPEEEQEDINNTIQLAEAAALLLPLASVSIDDVDVRDYTVVIPENADLSTQAAAQHLSDWMLVNAGFSLTVVTDTTAETDYEILIGNTNRSASQTVLVPDYAKMEYVFFKSGTKIVALGDSFMVGGGISDLLRRIPLTGSEETVNVTGLPTNPAVSTFAFKEAQNAIILIGDGMGFNQVDMFEDTTGKHFVAKDLPVHGTSMTDNVDGYTTDSAAGGTALSTGYKTINGALGQDKNGNSLLNIRELAHNLGAKTAVVSNDSLHGATPASFLVHNTDRGSYDAIDAEINNLLSEGKVTFAKGNVDSNLPSTTMDALKKISVLNGRYFMMVEEARIDWHCHNNLAQETVDCVDTFNDTIAYVIQFVLCHPDTVLFITADHETGGLQKLGDGTYDYTVGTHSSQDVPIYAIGYGTEIFDGQTVENYEIAKFMGKVYGDENFGQ